MKSMNLKTPLIALALLSVVACKKTESAESAATVAESATTAAASDSVSFAASQKIPGRKFRKTAEVNMEVKDTYDATVYIEQKLKELGGFVSESRLNSQVLSENTYETSDQDAVLVKKFQTDNKMQVRVPSAQLGTFLNFLNDKKVFLNSRIILADDVTNEAKIAALEAQKSQQVGTVISKMKNNGDKVDRTEQNLQQDNDRKIASMRLADDVAYSLVEIYVREPKVRVTEIAVTNVKNIDNKYKFNFFYDAKNAFVEGFYLIQRLLVGLISIWPILLIGSLIYYFIKKRKPSTKNVPLE